MGRLKFLQRLDFSRLSFRERALALVTLLAVLGAYFGFFLGPELKKVALLKTERESLRTELRSAREQLPLLSRQYESLKALQPPGETGGGFSGQLNEVLPGGSRLSAVLEEVTRLARLRQVEFVSIRPNAVADKGDYLQLNLQIDLQSRFRELGDYLLMLENLPRPLVVENLKVESRGEISPMIQAHLTTVTLLGKD